MFSPRTSSNTQSPPSPLNSAFVEYWREFSARKLEGKNKSLSLASLSELAARHGREKVTRLTMRERKVRDQRIADELAEIKRAEEEAAEKKRIAEEEAALKRAEEEAAAFKRAKEEAAALKRVEEEATLKRAAEEAEALRRAKEKAEALRKSEEEAAEKKRAEEEALSLKRAAEVAAEKRRIAEEALALKRAAEEALALKKAAEDEAARKRAEEDEAAEMKRVVEEAALVLGNLSGMDHTSPRAVLIQSSLSFSMVIPDAILVSRSPLIVRVPSETPGYSEAQDVVLNSSERSMTPLRFHLDEN